MSAQGCFNPGEQTKEQFLTLKGFVPVERFQRLFSQLCVSQGCRFAPTTGLELANTFGVYV